jgi:hypothetical protein
MVRLSFPKRTAALGLAALLTVSWASAAPPSRQPAARMAAAPESLLHQLWSLLRAATLDAGCNLQPDGHCASGAKPVTPTIDAGCSMQPDGRCASGG